MTQKHIESDRLDDDYEFSKEGIGQAKQYVTFTAGNSYYAVDIMSVREIKGWADITGLPNQPDYVRGVLNLRGSVLPIIDLKCRLGEGLTTPSMRHVIVIVAIEDRQIGLLVDAVSDIISVTDDQIKPVPEMNAKQDSNVFRGFLAEAEQMVAMLDLDNLLIPKLHEIESAAGSNLLQ